MGLRGLALHSLENLVVTFTALVDREHCGHVAAPVAVVGRGPYRQTRLWLEPVLESVHYQLMRSADQLEFVDMIELRCHLRAKQPSCSSV